MNDKPEIQPELSKKEAGGINRDFAVFAFFLFLSFFFWYLNSLGKETEAGMKYPVVFTNLPKERVIADKSQIVLDLDVKGKGSSIMKLRFVGKKDPLEIDFSKVNYKRVPGSRSQDYYIFSSDLVKSLTGQLRSECEITSIKPDTLFFTFEKVVSETGMPEDEN